MPAITRPIQLSERLFIVYSEIPHQDSSNVFFINGLVPTLVEAGGRDSFSQLVANLSQLGVQVSDIEQIIVTHPDYDHVQGAVDIWKIAPNIQIYIPDGDLKAALTGDLVGTASYIYKRPFVPLRPENCVSYADRDTFFAGDGELTAYHAPGHTPGSSILLGDIDGQVVAFAGDAIDGGFRDPRRCDVMDWLKTMEQQAASIEMMQSLPIDWILTGHEAARELPHSKSYLDFVLGGFGRMLYPAHFTEDEILNYKRRKAQELVEYPGRPLPALG